MSLNHPLVFARRISNLTDARYFAAKEVDFLGFILEPGADGFLDPVYMQAMREWVEGPAIMGEFINQAPVEHFNEAIKFYQLDGILLPYSDTLSEIEAKYLWVKMPVDSPDLAFVMDNAPANITGWLLELPNDAKTWSTFSEIIQPLCAHHKVILQYDGTAEEVSAIVTDYGLIGIAIKGADEEQVGIKSFDEVDAILEALEALTNQN